MQDPKIGHFILAGEISQDRVGIVKNCEGRLEMQTPLSMKTAASACLQSSYCGCVDGVVDGKSFRGATYGTVGMRVTWPRAASSTLMALWSSSVPTARSSSTRDFSYAAMAESNVDSAVASALRFCRTAVVVDLPN